MKNYELTYIVSSEVSEEEIKSLFEKIKSFLSEEAGILEEISKPSRKEPGYLLTLNFSLNPEKLASFEKKIKSESKILRYLISTKRVLPRIEKPIFAPRKLIKPSSAPLAAGLARAKPKKVELEEIDKKIEEILKE